MTGSQLSNGVQDAGEGLWQQASAPVSDLSQGAKRQTIFVIGCPRSGTTWVQAMLAAHPSIQSGPETHFFETLMPVYHLFQAQQAGVGGRTVGLPAYLSTEQFNAWLRAAFWSMVAANATAQVDPSSYFLEKTPQHGLYAEFILSVFPEARFIHVIRDARAVTASLLRASASWGKAWAPTNADEAAQFWRTHVEASRQIGTLVDAHHYVEIKYEELRLAPQQQLGKLFDWLGLALPPATLEAIVATNAIDQSQRTSVPFPAIVTNAQQYPAGFIGAAPIHVEEFELTARQRRQVEYRVGQLLQQLGYPAVRSVLSIQEQCWLGYALLQKHKAVRARLTVKGGARAVVRPLLTLVVFTLVFGRLAGLPSEGNMPYALLVGAALLPWQFFANALHESSNSLISQAELISKGAFPRLALPLTAVVSVVDFLITFLLLIGLMGWYQCWPTWRWTLLPLLTLLALAAALGGGIWIAALQGNNRDLRNSVPFLVQVGLYLSPVGFSSSIVPEQWRLLYSLNPMVGVIDGFRWAILGTATLYWPSVLLSLLLALALLASGLWYFRKTEHSVAVL